MSGAAKPGLKPLWTKQQVHGLFERLQDRTDEAIKALLARTGEEFVTLARGIRTYKDRTGNLRSSTGYAIFKDGVRIGNHISNAGTGEPGKKDGATGVAAGGRLAAEIGRTHSRGYVLVCFAGMSYAAIVESRGYDVITHSADKAEDFLVNEAAVLLRKLKL